MNFNNFKFWDFKKGSFKKLEYCLNGFYGYKIPFEFFSHHKVKEEFILKIIDYLIWIVRRKRTL